MVAWSVARAVTADDDPDFTIWLRNNPPPDLQALIEKAGRRHAESIGEKYDPDPFTRPPHQGGYQHITPEEWPSTTRQWPTGRHAAGIGPHVDIRRSSKCLLAVSSPFLRDRGRA